MALEDKSSIYSMRQAYKIRKNIHLETKRVDFPYRESKCSIAPMSPKVYRIIQLIYVFLML